MSSDAGTGERAAVFPPRPSRAVASSVRTACQRLFANETDFLDGFSQSLLSLVPRLSDLPGGRGKSLAEGLGRAVLWASLTEDSLEVVEATFQNIGTDFARQDFPDEGYQGAGHALLRAARDTYTGDWTSELSSGLVAFYGWLAAYLQRGAQAERDLWPTPVRPQARAPGLDEPAGDSSQAEDLLRRQEVQRQLEAERLREIEERRAADSWATPGRDEPQVSEAPYGQPDDGSPGLVSSSAPAAPLPPPATVTPEPPPPSSTEPPATISAPVAAPWAPSTRPIPGPASNASPSSADRFTPSADLFTPSADRFTPSADLFTPSVPAPPSVPPPPAPPSSVPPAPAATLAPPRSRRSARSAASAPAGTPRDEPSRPDDTSGTLPRTPPPISPSGAGVPAPAPRAGGPTTLDEVAALLQDRFFTGNDRAMSAVITRIALRTGADLTAPRPDQLADPDVIANVVAALEIMGFPVQPVPEPPQTAPSAEPGPPSRRPGRFFGRGDEGSRRRRLVPGLFR